MSDSPYNINFLQLQIASITRIQYTYRQQRFVIHKSYEPWADILTQAFQYNSIF